MKVSNIAALQRKLQQLMKSAKEQENIVVVGYSQRYAIWVHETNKNYRVGQWKYLEQPNREMRDSLKEIINQVFLQTKSMRKALLMAGFALLRASRELCPEDTGALKASGYVAMESEFEKVSAAAFATSEAIRVQAMQSRKYAKRRG